MEDITTRFINVYKHLVKNKIITTGKEFAIKIGISPQLLTEITKGRNEVGLKAIQNTLLAYSFINPTWLINGTGKMLLSFEDIAINSYKQIDQDTQYQVNADSVPYNTNSNKNECTKLIENYQLLLDQKDILINELKLLLEANRNAVKFSKVEQ